MHLMVEVEIVHFHRLVAFVTYQGYEDQSSVIMKLESVAAVSYHHGNACIGSETNTPKLEWTDGSRSRREPPSLARKRQS